MLSHQFGQNFVLGLGLSSPRTQSVSASPRPDGQDVPSPGRRRLRSQRTPSASDRRRWVAVHFPHTNRKLGPCLRGVASGWLLSLLRCSACALFSYVPSAILAKERLLHFQLRRDKAECGGERASGESWAGEQMS